MDLIMRILFILFGCCVGCANVEPTNFEPTRSSLLQIDDPVQLEIGTDTPTVIVGTIGGTNDHSVYQGQWVEIASGTQTATSPGGFDLNLWGMSSGVPAVQRILRGIKPCADNVECPGILEIGESQATRWYTAALRQHNEVWSGDQDHQIYVAPSTDRALGHRLTVVGGAAQPGSNGHGGTLDLEGGVADGTGTGGDVQMCVAAQTGSCTIGRAGLVTNFVGYPTVPTGSVLDIGGVAGMTLSNNIVAGKSSVSNGRLLLRGGAGPFAELQLDSSFGVVLSWAGTQKVTVDGDGTKIDGGNLGVGGTSFGGGSRVVFIVNATAVPTSNPVGGGLIYVEGGALKYLGPSGTVTVIANP